MTSFRPTPISLRTINNYELKPFLEICKDLSTDPSALDDFPVHHKDALDTYLNSWIMDPEKVEVKLSKRFCTEMEAEVERLKKVNLYDISEEIERGEREKHETMEKYNKKFLIFELLDQELKGSKKSDETKDEILGKTSYKNGSKHILLDRQDEKQEKLREKFKVGFSKTLSNCILEISKLNQNVCF